jgi:hypothetical protein
MFTLVGAKGSRGVILRVLGGAIGLGASARAVLFAFWGISRTFWTPVLQVLSKTQSNCIEIISV